MKDLIKLIWWHFQVFCYFHETEKFNSNWHVKILTINKTSHFILFYSIFFLCNRGTHCGAHEWSRALNKPNGLLVQCSALKILENSPSFIFILVKRPSLFYVFKRVRCIWKESKIKMPVLSRVSRWMWENVMRLSRID